MKKSELWWSNCRKSEYFESGHSNHSFGNRCRRPTEIKRLHNWTLGFYLMDRNFTAGKTVVLWHRSQLSPAARLTAYRLFPDDIQLYFFLMVMSYDEPLCCLWTMAFVFNSLVLRRAVLNPEKVSNQNESVLLLHGSAWGFHLWSQRVTLVWSSSSAAPVTHYHDTNCTDVDRREMQHFHNSSTSRASRSSTWKIAPLVVYLADIAGPGSEIFVAGGVNITWFW